MAPKRPPQVTSAEANAQLRNTVLEEHEIQRALKRIAHEIVERNKGAGDLALVGIQRRGVPLAERLAGEIDSIEGSRPPTGALDVSFYRDDIAIRQPEQVSSTDFPFDVDGTRLVIVDDVLFTGRTARAAIDAVMDFGRPLSVMLAVLVDRGHRELPIRADFVGKNLPTAKKEDVVVMLTETDGADRVEIGRSE